MATLFEQNNSQGDFTTTNGLSGCYTYHAGPDYCQYRLPCGICTKLMVECMRPAMPRVTYQTKTTTTAEDCASSNMTNAKDAINSIENGSSNIMEKLENAILMNYESTIQQNRS